MTAANHPSHFVDFDEYVGLKLEKTRATIRTTDLLTALAGVGAMFLGYLLLFVVLDQWVISGGFGVSARWVLLSTLMLSTIGWLVWKVGLPSMKSVNGLFAAQEIEKAEPGLKSNLLNLIDLKSAGRTINPVILKSMERQAAVRLQNVDVSQAINHRPLVHTAYVLLAVIIVFCFYALFSPKKISNSIWRGLFPASEVSLATITEILDVKPGDITVPAHQPFVDIQVDLAGEIPSQVWLLYTSADGKQDQPVELRPEQDGQTRFKGQLIGDGGQGLMQDLTYIIRAGDASSRPYKITVEQPPYAEIESVGIEFPSYMKLRSIDQANNGTIDAWEGAKVLVTAKTNMPVRTGMIQFLDDPHAGPTGEEVAMSTSRNGRQVQAQWTLALRNDGTFPKHYRIHCRTEDGRVTTGHVMNPLTIRPDLPPEVVLIQPDRDLEAPANAVIPLLIQARDPDFELGYLYLNIERAGQRIVHEKISDGHQPKLTLKHDLELSKLKLDAGETVDLWVEAYDNKQPRPNSKNTTKIKIRVVQPVSQKDAEQQFADQNDRREQKIAESDPELNQESTDPASMKDKDPKDRQPSDLARPNDSDQNLNEQPKDEQPNDGQQGAPQSKGQSSLDKNRQNSDPENGTGKSKNEQKSGAGAQKSDPSKPQSGEPSKPTKPLNDGTQDEEILRKINETINKNSKPKQDATNDPTQSEPPQTNDPSTNQSETQQPSADNPESNQSQPAAKPGTDSKPPQNGAPEKREQTDPIKNDPSQKSQPEKQPNEGTGPKSENKQNPKSDLNANNKSNPAKTGEKADQQDTSKSNPDEPKPQDDESNPSDDATDKTSEPKPEPAKSDDQDVSKPQKNSENNPGGNSKDKQKSTESDKNDSQSAESQSNENLPTGTNKKSTKQSNSETGAAGKPKPSQTDKNAKTSGDKEQADDSSDAQKTAADGTEKGTGKPDRDPQSQPKPAKNNNVTRDPNEKPETRQSPSKQEPGKEDPNQPGPGKKERGNTDKNNKKPKPQSVDDQNRETQSADDKGTPKDKTEKDQADQEGKPDGGKPGSEKDAQPSETGEPSDAQSSQQNSSSKNNRSKSQDQSKSKSPADPNSDSKDKDATAKSEPSGSKEQSESSADNKQDDKSSSDKKPGDSNSKSEKSSQSDGQKKDGDKSQKNSQDKGSDKSGKSDSGKSKSGSEDGQKSGKAGSEGKPANKPGGQPGEGEPKGVGGASESVESTATRGGETPELGTSEDANLDYNRRATELILQKLQKDLDRGDVDPELLEQLGWTKAEMKQFADRLSKSLSESKLAEETPEAKARQQQFQEMLKNLDLQKSGTRRTGENQPKRDVQQVESKRTPPPESYRKAYERFTKDLARQKAPTGDKPVK